MPLNFEKIEYKDLNSRQQEAYNYQKLSAVLADFGYITIPLSNDWNGADFIAQLPDGNNFIKVQLKSRLTFDQKYENKKLFICFRTCELNHDVWYMYDHDELLHNIPNYNEIVKSKTWESKKAYHFPTLSADLKDRLEPYRIPDMRTEQHLDCPIPSSAEPR